MKGMLEPNGSSKNLLEKRWRIRKRSDRGYKEPQGMCVAASNLFHLGIHLGVPRRGPLMEVQEGQVKDNT